MTAINSDNEPPLTLEAEILYEDFATGLRAHVLLDRVRRCLGISNQANEHLWRFDVLCQSKLLKEAVEEALRADVVVVSAHGDGALPDSLKNWAGAWMPCKGQDAPSVILSLDARLRSRGDNIPFVGSFKRLLGERCIDISPCFYEPSVVSALAWRHQMNERLRRPLARLGGAEHRPHDIGDWGINE
jgi:hypothetical protein